MARRNSWTAKGITLLMMAIVALFFAGWATAHDKDWPVPPEAAKVKNPIAPTSDNLAAAHAIYMDKCASCHGEKGAGDGPEADMYTPAPAKARAEAARKTNAAKKELVGVIAYDVYLPHRKSNSEVLTPEFVMMYQLFNLCQRLRYFVNVRHNGNIIILEPRDFSGLIHDRDCPARDSFIRQIHSKFVSHCAARIKISQQRVANPHLFRIRFVRPRAVHTQSKHLRVERLKLLHCVHYASVLVRANGAPIQWIKH